MKYFLLLLSITALAASAQTPLPKIDSAGKDVAGFIPPGWFVEHSAFGDLNNDKIEDMVIVIQPKDSMTESRYNCDTKAWDDEEKGFPRVLFIIFGEESGSYRLALQDNDFILRPDEGGMRGDPFEGEAISIKNNVLSFGFSGGTSQRWTVQYKFRYQHNDWYLIGASSGGYHSVLGTANENSYNLITGKVKITESEDIFGKEHATVKWKTIPKQELKTIKALGRPFCWEIEPGIFL
jgi:hypothetical protein